MTFPPKTQVPELARVVRNVFARLVVATNAFVPLGANAAGEIVAHNL